MRADARSEGAQRFPLGVIDVARPLVERAERFIETHPGRQETLRRLLMLRRTHLRKGGAPVRRRAARREFADPK
jgi:hypothetical protein